MDEARVNQAQKQDPDPETKVTDPEKKKTSGKKASRFSVMTLCRILGILAGVVVLLLFGLKIGEPIRYAKYYAKAQKEFSIAGLSAGLTVQGIDNVTDAASAREGDKNNSFLSVKGDRYLESGYMKDESTSRIYRVNTGRKLSENNKDYLLLCDENGKPSKTHAGGLTSSKALGKVWVCGAGESVLVYEMEDVLTAPAGSEIRATASLKVPLGSAYCFYDEGQKVLWVGEFYRLQNYPTDPSHHREAAGGVTHHSLVFGYYAEETSEYGVKEKPDLALSIPDLVQGMAVDKDGRIYLSSSYAVASSHLSVYEDFRGREEEETFSSEDQEIPLWYLDERTLLRKETLPPMSEDLCRKDGRVCIMNESATKKYLFGNLLHGKYVYSYQY